MNTKFLSVILLGVVMSFGTFAFSMDELLEMEDQLTTIERIEYIEAAEQAAKDWKFSKAEEHLEEADFRARTSGDREEISRVEELIKSEKKKQAAHRARVAARKREEEAARKREEEAARKREEEARRRASSSSSSSNNSFVSVDYNYKSGNNYHYTAKRANGKRHKFSVYVQNDGGGKLQFVCGNTHAFYENSNLGIFSPRRKTHYNLSFNEAMNKFVQEYLNNN